MSNVIEVGYGFTPAFRKEIFINIKYYGIKRTVQAMIDGGCHPSFAKGLIRNIIRKEGW